MSGLGFWLIVLLALGGMALLGHLARRHPWIGVVTGVCLLGLTVHFWRSTGPGSFRSDGSPAGAVLFVIFLSFELLLAIIGLWFIISAFTSGRDRERSEAAEARAAELRERRMAAIREQAVDGNAAPAQGTQAAHGAPAASGTTTPANAQQPEFEPGPYDDPRSLKANAHGGVALFAVLIGLLFAVPALRLLLGLSDELVCGRKSCFDPFGLFSWMQRRGGSGLVGLCYLALSMPFFWFASRQLWPRARKRRAWLDKYRKPPRDE